MIRRYLYTPINLQWVRDTQWDKFLDAYWLSASAQAWPGPGLASDDLPTCKSTLSCKELASQGTISRIYIPVASR
jgi:hypothetical protein